MKRGGPLRRKKPLTAKKGLARKTPLKAGKALDAGKGLRRSRKPAVSAQERTAMGRWGKAPTGACCAVCGRTKVQAWMAGTRLHAHHVISKQRLKKLCASRKLDRVKVLWDIRNRMWLCGEPCHRQHTDRVKPIPRKLVPRSAWEFAAELALTRLIEEEYR